MQHNDGRDPRFEGGIGLQHAPQASRSELGITLQPAATRQEREVPTPALSQMAGPWEPGIRDAAPFERNRQ
jgi:hypothetical protein